MPSNLPRDEYNAYMREYMLKRYHAQMARCIAALGGRCVACGSTSKLQIDHIDRTTKVFTLSKGWSKGKAAIEKELEKCQLLCAPCHNEKTVVRDLGQTLGKGLHGTPASYRYCHPPCELCREAWREYRARLKRRRMVGRLGLEPRITG